MSNFTEYAIKTSLMRLLNERPLSRITVRDIVEDCCISRSSFYYHYRDIPDLLEHIIQEETDRIISDHPFISSSAECLDAMIRHALRNKKVVLHIWRSANRESLERELMLRCEYFVSAYAESYSTQNTALTQEQKRDITVYYKYLLMGFMLDWLDSGLSPEKAEHFRCLLTSRDPSQMNT